MSHNINPVHTRVLLIGNSQYDHNLQFGDIPPIENNLKDLRRYLRDESILGVLDHNIYDLLNASKLEIYTKIVQLCQDPSIQTLILYYAGHGTRKNSRYYLTARDTSTLTLEESGLDFRLVIDQLAKAKAANQILIIDGCYSGKATKNTHNMESFLPIPNKNKLWIMTSTSSYNPSYFSRSRPHTFFTGAILEQLFLGTPRNGSHWDINHLFQEVKRKMTKDLGLPAPWWKSNTGQKLRIFKNRNAPEVQEGETNLLGSEKLEEMNGHTFPSQKKEESSSSLGGFILFCIICFFLWQAGRFVFKQYQDKSFGQLEPGIEVSLPGKPLSYPLSEEKLKGIKQVNLPYLLGLWYSEEENLNICFYEDSTFHFKRGNFDDQGRVHMEQEKGYTRIRLLGSKLNYMIQVIHAKPNSLQYHAWKSKEITLLRN